MLKLMGKHPIADERQHNIFFYLYRLCLSVLHSAPGDMSAGILRHGLSALSRCSEDGQSGALRLTWLRDSRVQVGVLPSGTAVRPAGGGGGGDGSDGSEGGGGDAGPAPRLTITALHPRRLVAAANVAQTMQAWTWPPTLRAWAPGEWPPWMPNPPTPQEVAMHEGLPPLPGLRVALHGPALKNHASVDDRRDADQDADSAYTRPPPASEEEAGQEQGGGARSESSRRRALYKELEVRAVDYAIPPLPVSLYSPSPPIASRPLSVRRSCCTSPLATRCCAWKSSAPTSACCTTASTPPRRPACWRGRGGRAAPHSPPLLPSD